MALLAFEDGASAAAVSPQLGALWDVSARHDVAGQLNSALLVAQAQEPVPRLPGLVKQLAWAQAQLDSAGVGVPHVALDKVVTATPPAAARPSTQSGGVDEQM